MTLNDAQTEGWIILALEAAMVIVALYYINKK
jgi:hypothetical protein